MQLPVRLSVSGPLLPDGLHAPVQVSEPLLSDGLHASLQVPDSLLPDGLLAPLYVPSALLGSSTRMPAMALRPVSSTCYDGAGQVCRSARTPSRTSA